MFLYSVTLLCVEANKINKMFFNYRSRTKKSKHGNKRGKYSLAVNAENSQRRYIARRRIAKGLNGKQRQKTAEGETEIMVIVKVITPPLFMIVILCS